MFKYSTIPLFFLLLLSISFSTIFQVNTSAGGCGQPTATNYTTMAAALGAANDGDTIYVCKSANPYSEFLVINDSVNIYGNESGVVINTSATSTNNHLINLYGNSINITNFTFTLNATRGGIEINGSNTRVFGNVFRHGGLTSTGDAIDISLQAQNITIQNNTFQNISDNAIDLGPVASPNGWFLIHDNVFYNISGPFRSYGGNQSNINVTNNLMYNISDASSGILVRQYGTNLRIANNNITGFIELQHNSNAIIVNNTINGSSSDLAVRFANASNHSFINNTIFGTSFLNIYLLVDGGSSNINFTNNTIYNGSTGFSISNSTGILLSNNTLTNHTGTSVALDSSANVTLVNNQFLSNPSTSLDLNVSGGGNATTLVGSTYNNFTTSYGTIFFDNAINVTVKLMNLSDSSASSTGCSGFTGTCTLLTLSNNLVNISNASATGTIILGMFYNTSTSPTSSNVYIGKYVTANSGWQQVGQTAVDTTNGTVRYGAITSFSTFGIVNFVASSSSPPSSDNPPNKKFDVSYTFSCESGSLDVTSVKGARVRLIQISPDYFQVDEKEADSDGKTLFTITQSGTYRIRASKSGFIQDDTYEQTQPNDPFNNDFELALCDGESEPDDFAGCKTDDDCSLTEQCLSSECVPVTGECGYVSNREWISYECCSNSDCQEGYECKDNSCSSIPEPEKKEEKSACDELIKKEEPKTAPESEPKECITTPEPDTGRRDIFVSLDFWSTSLLVIIIAVLSTLSIAYLLSKFKKR